MYVVRLQEKKCHYIWMIRPVFGGVLGVIARYHQQWSPLRSSGGMAQFFPENYCVHHQHDGSWNGTRWWRLSLKIIYRANFCWCSRTSSLPVGSHVVSDVKTTWSLFSNGVTYCRGQTLADMIYHRFRYVLNTHV